MNSFNKIVVFTTFREVSLGAEEY